MDVYIGRVNVNTTKTELLSFLAPCLRRSRFLSWLPRPKRSRPTVRMHLYEVLTPARTREAFAVVSVTPDALAYKIIHALDGKRVHGSCVVVREYHHRAANHDRRLSTGWRDRPAPNGAERRGNDRRRRLEIEEVVSMDFGDTRHLARKHDDGT